MRAAERGRHGDAGSRATSTAAGSRRGTSRSSGGCRGTCPLTSPTSAPRATAATRGSTSTCRRRYGGGAASRPYFATLRPAERDPVLGSAAARPRYNSLQVAFNKSVHAAACMFKGAYTLSKSMNESDDDGRTGFDLRASRSSSDRNWAVAGFDRTHNLQLGFVYQLPWQNDGGGYDNVPKAILGDWQVNGVVAAFSGTPFTVTADGTSLNTPGITQTRESRRRRSPCSANIGGGAASGSTRPRSLSRPASPIGNTGRNQFRGPGALERSTCRCSATFPLGGQRQLELPVPGRTTSSITRCSPIPSSRHHLGHLRTDHRHRRRRSYPERQHPARSALPVLSGSSLGPPRPIGRGRAVFL